MTFSFIWWAGSAARVVGVALIAGLGFAGTFAGAEPKGRYRAAEFITNFNEPA
jgi:hypothetical protein